MESNHEISYRSKNTFERIQKASICICGVGALGSNLVNNLARQGIGNITIIDMDRVEKHNIATQTYSIRDVGKKKAQALRAYIFENTGKVIIAIDKELRANNAKKFLKGFDLIIDVFDNWKSRRLAGDISVVLKTPIVHAGMSDNGFSEIKWKDYYRIPEHDAEQKDICDYPLAANLVHITSSILAEIVIQFIADGEMLNREITLKDLKVHTI